MNITHEDIATAVAGLGTLEDVHKTQVYGWGGRKAAALVTIRSAQGVRIIAEVQFRANRSGVVTANVAQSQIVP